MNRETMAQLRWLVLQRGIESAIHELGVSRIMLAQAIAIGGVEGNQVATKFIEQRIKVVMARFSALEPLDEFNARIAANKAEWDEFVRETQRPMEE